MMEADMDMGMFADYDLLADLKIEEKLEKLFEDAELAWVDENNVVHFYPTTTIGKHYTEFCINSNEITVMTDD